MNDFEKLMNSVLDEGIDQPLVGLLYDLNMLPEQLEKGSNEYMTYLIVKRMHERLNDDIIFTENEVKNVDKLIKKSITNRKKRQEAIREVQNAINYIDKLYSYDDHDRKLPNPDSVQIAFDLIIKEI